jgi:hypothetical protein
VEAIVREGEHCLPRDPQMLRLLVQFAQSAGQFVDVRADLFGLGCDGLLACRDLVQRLSQHLRPGHASRQLGVLVPVSRRAITSVIAQWTGDSELAGRPA